MVFSYNWLQSFFNTKLPKPEKLAELLTMASFQVERLEKKGADWVLDIDILPNRAGDCLSHIGVAREIGAVAQLKIISPRLTCLGRENEKLKSKSLVEVKVENSDDCPRYTAMVVENVKVGESPKWIKERLMACGLRPINNVVDITNYAMLETGQPMHAFDADKVEDKKIIVRRAKRGEKIISLDNQEYVLDESVLVIADTEKPLAIAGIKGGTRAEISRETKTIILEAANFNQTLIRKTSRKLGLRTDASLRFEHNLDPNLTSEAIELAVKMLKEIAGGVVDSRSVDFYPKKVLPKKIALDINYLNRLLGINIPKQEIIRIFKGLDFKLQITNYPPARLASKRAGEAGKLLVQVPTYRLDLNTPEDLIEEVGRLYGYEKIPAVFPSAVFIPPAKNSDILWEQNIKDMLLSAGFYELYNHSFIGDDEAKLFNYSIHELVEVENPVSVKQKYLRSSLIINILKNLKENLRYADSARTFEIGKVFGSGANGAVKERKAFTGLLANQQAKPADLFYQAKGVIDNLLGGLGLTDIWYDEYQAGPEQSKVSIWQNKRIAEIKVGGEEIGFLGEIAPRILTEMKIKAGVLVFDFDFEKLVKLSSEEREYQPISLFPAAIRDLAVLAPTKTKVEDAMRLIGAAGGELVADIDLFDIYEGAELPENKKNFAFHITFQTQDRTLSSKEIDALMAKIMRVLEEEGWEVRK